MSHNRHKKMGNFSFSASSIDEHSKDLFTNEVIPPKFSYKPSALPSSTIITDYKYQLSHPFIARKKKQIGSMRVMRNSSGFYKEHMEMSPPEGYSSKPKERIVEEERGRRGGRMKSIIFEKNYTGIWALQQEPWILAIAI